MGRHSGFFFGLSIVTALVAGLVAKGLDLRAQSTSDTISQLDAVSCGIESPPSNSRIRTFVAPANSLIVVTSLDRTGARHSFSIRATETPSTVDLLSEIGLVATTTASGGLFEQANPVELHRTLPVPAIPGNPGDAGQMDTARSGYDVASDPPGSLDGNSGDTRRFLAPRYGNASVSETLVDAVCISSTGNVAIYLDTTLSENQEANVLANLGRLTALKIDLLTFLITTRLGAIHDLDHDGRLSILITELDCQDDRAVPVLGCVRPSDFLGQSDESSSEPAELSDVVYLDESLPPQSDLTALLAHELAHAAVYCRLYDRRVNKQVPLELPEWLHEGIAHHQESLLANETSVFLERQVQYHNAPHRCPVCPNPTVSSRDERRGGSRVAVTRFLQFALRQDQSWGRWLREADDTDSLLASCLRDDMNMLLPDWALSEAIEIDRQNPASIGQLLPANSVTREILGTAFTVLRTGDQALEVVVECCDSSAWTVVNTQRPASIEAYGLKLSQSTE